jgi:hypothetical protein
VWCGLRLGSRCWPRLRLAVRGAASAVAADGADGLWHRRASSMGGESGRGASQIRKVDGAEEAC